jgi:hypothetical protein
MKMINRVKELIKFCKEYREKGTVDGIPRLDKNVLTWGNGDDFIVWDQQFGILISVPKTGLPIIYPPKKVMDPFEELEGQALIGRQL